MADQADIFNKDNSEGSQTPAVVAPNDANTQVDQLLQGIKNEQGEAKYKSVEDALAALQASQEHIGRLETENSEFKSKQLEGATLQAVLDAVKPQAGDAEPAGSQLTGEQITELVTAQLSKRETEQTRGTNVDVVTSKFKELYGEKAGEEYYAQAEAKGLSKEWINSLAATNPSAVFKVLGVEASKAPASMSSSNSTEQFNQEAQKPKVFDPFTAEPSSDLVKWRTSAKATLDRLEG